MKTDGWVPVMVAADIAGRDRSRVYAWVREDRLESRETVDGIILVRLADVVELESIMNKRRNNKTRR